MSEQWIDTEFSDKAPTLDALEAQLDGESWSSRIQRDPLFAAQLAVVDCSDEVVKRTEHYEARITEYRHFVKVFGEFSEDFDGDECMTPVQRVLFSDLLEALPALRKYEEGSDQ